MRSLILAGLLCAAAAPALAADDDDRFDCASADNSTLCALYRADQEIRKPPVRDLNRLDDPAAVRSARDLIDRGKLRTGNDYSRAATILIHSSKPEDHLLAHVVAAEGISQAPSHFRVRLLAALSLDRYLLGIGQPQVFGTQMTAGASGMEFRMPLDCKLIDLSLRTTFLSGDYPEPCPDRRPAATSLSRSSLMQTVAPQAELIRHIRVVEQLSKPSADKIPLRRAAESLDAYLLAAGQPQAFGTQIDSRAALERLDCALLSPGIRNAFSVVDICDRKDRATAAFVR